MNINGVSASTSSLNSSSERIDSLFEQLSSGKRINSAADDAAGLAISTQMSSETQGQMQAIANASDGIALTQTAAGALETVTDNVQRIRELSVQAANSSYSATDREAINSEAQMLVEQTNSVLESANFNGVSLFNSSDDQVFQIGPEAGDTLTVEANDLTTQIADMGFGSIDLSSAEGASAALEMSDSVLDSVSSAAAEFGAVQNRFESVVSGLEQSVLSSTATTSQIQDTDYAETISALASEQVKEQAALAVQAMANENQGNVLRLLGT
ncbi:flagellin [Reinekea marinisedimentorum]|uniref:Flagellin n=1 Tax=Reinekea marinisedimentorum TaxID=230495 RepID=A0A4R3HS94_9GAMM|nr:flagellin [Reinekea marinisedimentorum]TCS35872.1 flagellin [Reinekea marinisedimentorum]